MIKYSNDLLLLFLQTTLDIKLSTVCIPTATFLYMSNGLFSRRCPQIYADKRQLGNGAAKADTAHHAEKDIYQ